MATAVARRSLVHSRGVWRRRRRSFMNLAHPTPNPYPTNNHATAEAAPASIYVVRRHLLLYAPQKNANKPAVFLGGGIGITPFLSIVREADHDCLPHKLYLFYSNRRPEDAAFLDILQGREKTNPNFRLVATMTEMARSSREWRGETGFINREMLARHLGTLQGPSTTLPDLHPWSRPCARCW
jgi:hypothetical protein